MSWCRGLIGLGLLVAALGALEGTYRLLQIEYALADELVDIQTPNQLLIKLHRLQQFDGLKVVFVGDSIVYGGILKDFGDNEWRDHTLSALLRQRYAAEFPSKKVLVMNLGINGALPMDIEYLMKLIVPCKPDLVVLGTHLRPFSVDFDRENESMARPWLSGLIREEDGSFHYRPVSTNWSDCVNVTIADHLRNQFSVFRGRDTIQTMFRQEPILNRFADFRGQLNGRVVSSFASNIEQDSMILLLQSKKRFSTVRIDESHRQVMSLRRTLAYLKGNEQKSIVFYVKENPDQVDGVIDEDAHRRLYSQLMRLFEEFGGPHLAYVAPIPDLESKHFLDLSHLNHEGYRILADHIWKAALAQ